jgi:hypothetical protein
MEPLLIILVPGLFGGIVLAVLIALNPFGIRSNLVPRRLAPPSPALINMAHINVEGVGGLGMVASVVMVAVWDPRIRVAMIIAAVFGGVLALVLIAMRQRTGGLPSRGGGPDGRSMLRIDDERRAEYFARAANRSSRTRRTDAVFTPAAG